MTFPQQARVAVWPVLTRALCFSDGENVPESVPALRPSRRAKTAALEKTKLDLNPLINQEANLS